MSKTKILIVDDRPENIFALSKLIESDEVEIHSASLPENALNLVLDHDFALALLDVQMPQMSGFELAKLIRGVERTSDLPIIFVTAHAREASMIFEGYETGAVDVLFKPLDPHVVRSKVRVFVRLDQQSKLLKERVETMAHLKERAEEASVAKSRFLANMSHEIRTPLAAVMGFSEVLLQKDASEEEKEDCVAAIRRNGELLMRIIDDILDLSKIEAAKLELDLRPFDLDDLVRDLELTLTHKASEKGIQFEFHKPAPKTGHYVSDPLRLKQILLNVIGNAIKFTDKGSVKARLLLDPNLRPGSDDQVQIAFEVVDTGVGLTDEEAGRLFQPFSQGDTSMQKRFGGTGLGLVISRELARSLGGDVRLVRSEKGKGSQFFVSVAVQPVSETDWRESVRASGRQTQVVASSIPLEGKRILVVDDVIDNRRLIERYLKSTGAKVEQADGGQSALRFLRAESVDAVLMDIQMPAMDGYETTRALREMGFSKPIIALTAHAMQSEIERCMASGCNSILTKPVSRADLIGHLSREIGH